MKPEELAELKGKIIEIIALNKEISEINNTLQRDVNCLFVKFGRMAPVVAAARELKSSLDLLIARVDANDDYPVNNVMKLKFKLFQAALALYDKEPK